MFTASATPARSGPAPVLSSVAAANSISPRLDAAPRGLEVLPYRVAVDGTISLYKQLTLLAYVDTSVTPGNTYRYQVAAA